MRLHLCESVRVWTQATQQLIRSIRAHRSQEAFSRRLGVSAGTIAAWENGRRAPTLATMLSACAQWNDDPVPRLRDFHPVPFDAEDVPGWLTALQGNQTQTELASKAGVSRHQVGRWLSGRATPRLPEFLSLVHALTGRGEDFVALWVPIDDVPVLKGAWVQRQQARALAWEEPWSEALLQLVRTSAYRACPEPTAEVLAQWLGAPVPDIARTLTRLREAGLLLHQNGRDHPGEPITVDTGHDPVAVRGLKRHWAHVAAERAGTPDVLCAYNVFACAPDDLGFVREELLSTFRRIRARVAASANSDDAALLLVQLVPFAPTPSDDSQGA